MSSSPYWVAYLFQVTTGAVVQEIPLLQDPQFSRQLNTEGSFSVSTLIGGDGLEAEVLRGIIEGGRFGVALVWNMGNGATDFIAAAGPIWTFDVDDTINQVTIGGSDLWGLLNARLMVPGGWSVSQGFGDATSVAIYGPDNYGNIALDILTDASARSHLQMMLPPPSGTGTRTMSYFGYDMATVGQRLQELTQLDQGPDIDFVPFFSAPGVISYHVMIGYPYITYNMQSVWLDYKSSVPSIKVSSDSSKLASIVYVKGNGTGAETTWATASDTTLTNAGWPLLEYVDNSHGSQATSGSLQDFANADIKLFGRPVETWSATVRMDKLPYFGNYLPGMYVTFNVTDHPWIPDGTYLHRIIGYTQGDNQNEIQLILQSQVGTV